MKKEFFLSLVIAFLYSCETANKKSILTADNIIKKSLIAHGGKNALKGITSQNENGVTLIFINDSLFRSNQYVSLKKTGGKSYYQSPSHQKKYGKKLIFANNGDYSWTQNDGAFAPYLQPQEEHISQGGEDYPYLLNLDARGVKTFYVETIIEESETLHRVDYTSSEGIKEEVYFADSSWLIRKTRRFIETSQGTAEMLRYFNDYRIIKNVAIPFRTEAHFPPREMNINIIKSLQLNDTILDSRFEFPKPKNLGRTEINAIVGAYYNLSKDVLKIFRKEGKILVEYNNQPATQMMVVDENLLMFRDGIGGGSRIANVFLKKKNNKTSLEIHLRDIITEWVKK